MERAPPPALAAAALAAMDEAFMDTSLSPKRPREDDPPDQVGAGASGPRPRIPENGDTTACMIAAASMQHTHTTPHSHPNHTTQEGRSNREKKLLNSLAARATLHLIYAATPATLAPLPPALRLVPSCAT